MYRYYQHDLQLSPFVSDSWEGEKRVLYLFQIFILHSTTTSSTVSYQSKQASSSETWQALKPGVSGLYIYWCGLNAHSHRQFKPHASLLFLGVHVKLDLKIVLDEWQPISLQSLMKLTPKLANSSFHQDLADTNSRPSGILTSEAQR